MAVDLTDEELVATFAGYALDHDNKAVFRARLDHELRIMRCADCGTWHEPPRPICPRCWSTNVVATPVSGRGTIFMAIFLHQGPPAPGVDYATPYPVVTVELDEQAGLRFTSTVVGRGERRHRDRRAGARSTGSTATACRSPCFASRSEATP